MTPADILFRLYAHLDDRDFAGLGDLLTDDAVGITPGGTARGREALVAQARRNHEQVARLAHRVTNVLAGP